MAAGDHTVARSERAGKRPKPTVAQLGANLADLDWQRSGTGAGSLEVAFLAAGLPPQSVAEAADASWVLLRVADDPAGRVLIYDRTEWLCFIDGVVRGEFG